MTVAASGGVGFWSVAAFEGDRTTKDFSLFRRVDRLLIDVGQFFLRAWVCREQTSWAVKAYEPFSMLT